MLPESELYKAYLSILQEELIPAMGCTEPIAVAYVAAVARDRLGALPERAVLEACGNIIKNVRSVVVPNTNGRKGLEAAVAIGFLAGNAEKALEVLSDVTDAEKEALSDYLAAPRVTVRAADCGGKTFYLRLTAFAGGESVSVTMEEMHTNITRIEKNGAVVFDKPAGGPEESDDPKRALLNVRDICDFADSVRLYDVQPLIDRQIAYNTAIANEGLAGRWGAEIGRILLRGHEGDPDARAKALAAAGSDARMSGCELPVIIVSGSGNQGMTASLPVISYAETLSASAETLCRALVLSDLVTVHQKTGIGRLSAFCGAVCAGCGAAAGIAYLHDGRADYTAVAHTVVNALAIASGRVCAGAKPSCAAKIAIAVDAGLLGYRMYKNGQEFRDGEGIVVKGVDNTIRNVGRMAHDGMRETDREILEIMTEAR